ncbi:unnamed protein product [Ambrosiozyma monospora]|uniref:Unnamed protein product n=1 Tax=Ambrosiozyma monospora TaxID=43982 RepID=A0ACB5TD88_AMBMO|nr:unnamed protein product [Ambrosiozyma monospora]
MTNSNTSSLQQQQVSQSDNAPDGQSQQAQQQQGQQQIYPNERIQFVTYIVNALKDVQGDSFNTETAKRAGEECERNAFGRSANKQQYVELLKTRLNDIKRIKQRHLARAQGQREA